LDAGVSSSAEFALFLDGILKTKWILLLLHTRIQQAGFKKSTMKLLHRKLAKLCFPLLLLQLLVQLAASDKVSITIVNVAEEPIEVYWKDEKSDTQEDPLGVPLEEIQPSASASLDSHPGHTFNYMLGDNVHSITVGAEEAIHTYVIGPSKVNVQCSTSTGDLHAVIMPDWSPFGAARFLELVRIGYFNGCALNRVVKGFLTQFGIGANYEDRTEWSKKSIRDDVNIRKIAFEPGILSYAGYRPNSRTTEMFVVMPDTPKRQLEKFGENDWETPFGYVEKQDLEDVIAKWEAYGDMPPWGNGPDSKKIYPFDGYHYLKREFPDMSYILECHVVPQSEEPTPQSEEPTTDKDEL
jgi:cyclophilin family peptidyl-prolyl cis-trans isomerase